MNGIPRDRKTRLYAPRLLHFGTDIVPLVALCSLVRLARCRWRQWRSTKVFLLGGIPNGVVPHFVRGRVFFFRVWHGGTTAPSPLPPVFVERGLKWPTHRAV